MASLLKGIKYGGLRFGDNIKTTTKVDSQTLAENAVVLAKQALAIAENHLALILQATVISKAPVKAPKEMTPREQRETFCPHAYADKTQEESARLISAYDASTALRLARDESRLNCESWINGGAVSYIRAYEFAASIGLETEVNK